MPDTPKRPATFAELMAESARLKRQSADILKRMAELDEKIARAAPLVSPPRQKKKAPPRTGEG